MTTNDDVQKNSYMVPLAIIIAGLLIGGAVVYSNNTKTAAVDTRPETESSGQDGSASGGDSAGAENVRPVSREDHIRGDPEALVKVIEFSDLECPFCKRFHPTMLQVMKEYGEGGRVAWVYRHFPLEQIHPKARKEAEATECANELGGNAKFWAYVDRLFEITPSNNGLDLDKLPAIAREIGLDRKRFEECLASGKFAKRVEEDYQDAIRSGGRGTPYSIVIAPNGEKLAVSGAQPYSAMKQVIEAALKLDQ